MPPVCGGEVAEVKKKARTGLENVQQFAQCHWESDPQMVHVVSNVKQPSVVQMRIASFDFYYRNKMAFGVLILECFGLISTTWKSTWHFQKVIAGQEEKEEAQRRQRLQSSGTADLHSKWIRSSIAQLCGNAGGQAQMKGSNWEDGQIAGVER